MDITAKNAGFTVIEVIVTLFVASLFVGVVLQMSATASSQKQHSITRADALNVAESNLNKFPDSAAVLAVAKETSPYDASAAPFYCKPGTSWTATGKPDGFDSQANTNTAADANAPGITLIDNDSSHSELLPTSISSADQRVAITAPQGCASDDAAEPSDSNIAVVKVESTVTYGPPDNRNTVRTARYVSL